MKQGQTLFLAAVFCLLANPAFGGVIFSPAVNYATGDYPWSVYATDIDGDGDNDLAVANGESDNISILRNNGDGTFAAPVNYVVGDSPQSVFAADLDGDGDSDLAVANWRSNNVSILKNNGDGTFAAAVNYGVGSNPLSVYAADLDGDGDSDLAVANYFSNNISILKNKGDGTFWAAVNYTVQYWPWSVYATDLDGDGDRDLAVANYNTDNVAILRNNGNGTFSTPVYYPAGDTPISVYAADLDGDGDSDLAVANALSDNVSILKNNGNGTFGVAVNYVVGDSPQSVYAIDLDADGDRDLAVANTFSNSISILENNGNGTFLAAVNYGVGFYPRCVYATDLDGDGDIDLAAANSNSDNVSILLNTLAVPEQLPDLIIDLDHTCVAQAVVSQNLIQGKPTVVRVFLKNIGEPFAVQSTWNGLITARLHILDQNGTELHTLESTGGWSNNGEFSHEDKKRGADAINFYLDPPSAYHLEISGSDYQRKFWVEVDILDAVHESNESNNSTVATPMIQSFRVPAEQRFAYCSASASLFPPNWPEMRDAHMILSQTYPLNFNPVGDYWIPWDHEWILASTWPRGWAYFCRLDLILALYNMCRGTNDPYIDRLVAFVPQLWDLLGTVGGLRQPLCPSIVLVNAGSVDQRTKLKYIVAHEIGHTNGLQGEFWEYKNGKFVTSDPNYCLPMTDCDIDKLRAWYRNGDCPIDIQNAGCANFPALCPQMGTSVGRFVSETAFKVSEKRPAAWAPGIWDRTLDIYWDDNDPGHDGCYGAFYGHAIGRCGFGDRTFNFMGAQNYSDDFYWITNDTYEFLVSRLIGSDGTTTLAEQIPSSALLDLSQIWIYGILMADDQVQMYSWYLQETDLPTDVLTGSGYSIDFLDSSGGSLASYPFGAVFGDDGAVPIALHLPYPGGTKRIEIQKAGIPIYGRDVSSSGPSVTLTGPSGGTLSGEIDITWSATDPDGDSTKVDLLYSPDGGTSWMPLGFGLGGGSFAVSADSLPGTDAGRFRVIASDGIHVAEDMSDGLFTITGKPPTVEILAPADSSTVVAGRSVTFEGVLDFPRFRRRLQLIV